MADAVAGARARSVGAARAVSRRGEQELVEGGTVVETYRRLALDEALARLGSEAY